MNNLHKYRNAKYVLLALTLMTDVNCTSVVKAYRSQLPLNDSRPDALAYFADSVGNQDGVIQKQESDYLFAKLREYQQLYMVTQSPSVNYKSFRHSQQPLFVSQEQIKEYYKGKGIRDRVGILRFDKFGNITRAWSTGGYI